MQSEAMPEITQEMLQDHPLLLLYLLFVGLAMFLIGGGSLASWAWLAYRRHAGLAILPAPQPWYPRCWSFLDMVFIGGSVVALQILFATWAINAFGIDRTGELSLEATAAGGMASLFGVGLGIMWIVGRYRQPPSHLGFTPISWRTIGIGLVAALLALPLVYTMMLAVSLISEVEYEHPLISSTVESGTLASFMMAFFAAAVAAPLAEEFVFRVILQGWLQSLPFKSAAANLLGSVDWLSPWTRRLSAAAGQPGESGPDDQPILAEIIEPPTPDHPGGADDQFTVNQESMVASHWSYLPPDDKMIAPGPITARLTSETPRAIDEPLPPLWPSIVTGILFGLAHFSYGMSFVPLSVLGIYLGLIYRRTHSIWPCVIVHMMLNTLSMIMLGLMILVKQAAG